MKRKFYKLIILLLILSAFSLLMLTSCSETPDEPVTDNPPEQNPIEEQIKLNMTYSQICELIGSDGIRMDLPSMIYSWEIDGKSFYAWFQTPKFTHTAPDDLICTKFGYRDALKCDTGSTYAEIVDIMNCEGTALELFNGIYMWETVSDQNLYVRFERSEDSDELIFADFCYSKYIENIGVSTIHYDAICQILQSEGEKHSIVDEIYGWQFCGGTVLIQFEENEDEELSACRFDFWGTSNLIGQSYESISKILCNSGELYEHEYAQDTIYRWVSPFKHDLFVFFDDNMIATRFSYEEDLTIGIDTIYPIVDLVLEKAEYFSGNINQGDYTYVVSVWHTKRDYDLQIYCSYNSNENKQKIAKMMKVPWLPIKQDMRASEVSELFGSKGETHTYISIWHFGIYDFYVYFHPNTLRLQTARFILCEGHEEKTE